MARTKRAYHGDPIMFLILALVLVILWAGGFFAFHIAGGLIHLLIVLAVIMVVIHLIQGRRAL
jgi:low affinity Fe/Cu permease